MTASVDVMLMGLLLSKIVTFCSQLTGLGEIYKIEDFPSKVRVFNYSTFGQL